MKQERFKAGALHLPDGNDTGKNKYDYFLSYAREDSSFVAPLIKAMEAKESEIYSFEKRFDLGGSIRKSIDTALLSSKYVIVVLSQSYMKKKWTMYELDSAISLEDDARIILPIWHNISREEVLRHSPHLASRVYIGSGELGVDDLAEKFKLLVEREI
jgi:TIR domain